MEIHTDRYQMEITLDQLLASREVRASFQRELLQKYPGKTLVCLTVVMPGTVKRNSQSLIISQAALCALIARFGSDLVRLETRDLPTGFEAYLLTSLSHGDAKRAVCNLEDSHPLGRLFDLDVILPDGTPMSRDAVGLPQRSCLLCGNPARYCMRNRTHSTEELLERIDTLVKEYVR